MVNLCNGFKGRSGIFQIRNFQLIRNYVTAIKESSKTQHQWKMGGWQIHSYGDLDELQYSDKVKIPAIKSSDEVLIKVKASGVNPIDINMIEGYGSKLINVLRCNTDGIEFPLTLGREFSGVVCQKGMGSTSDVEVGELVWGVVPIQRNGCHAEYVVVPQSCIARKPEELTIEESGGALYTGLTAWSGIFLTGQMGGCYNVCSNQSGKGRGKRILVLGASGGVGSAAVQILKAEQASVVASCSTDAVSIVQGLGVDHVIDYTNQEDIGQFSECGPYDMILDCAGLGQNYATKFGWSYKSFITFTSPMLRNVDEYGVPVGVLRNMADIIESNARSLTTKQGFVKWAYFFPSQIGIKYLEMLVKRKKYLPLKDSSFNFDNTIDAYKKVKCGHLRGKVVINVDHVI